MKDEIRFIGNYRITDVIDMGGHGCVYLAQHIHLGWIVAIKVPHSTRVYATDAREKFLQEARILANLDHPHILKLHDFGIEEGRPYLVTEYASGGSLRQRLRTSHPHIMPINESMTILTQIGQALQFAHDAKTIHRDLKPENILFTDNGNALLADFSIAYVQMTGHTYEHMSTIIGTPPYMAPEQFAGFASVKSDIYSFSVIAYELCAGFNPFSAPDLTTIVQLHTRVRPVPPHQINTAVPLHISRAIMTALAKEPGDRQESVQAFLDALLQQPPDVPQAKKVFSLPQSPLILRSSKEAVEDMILRGIALSEQGKNTQALAVYDKVLARDPRNAEAYNNKGNILFKQHRYTTAVWYYDLAISYQPDRAEFHLNRGIALDHLRRYKEALAAYRQALVLDATLAQAHNGLGNAWYHMNIFRNALLAYEQAIALAPDVGLYHSNRGKVLTHLGRYQEARWAFQRARQLGYY